ncbi:MAG: putative CRISPR-associated protein [bacterium]
MTKTIIISTVGTSVFTNYIEFCHENELEKLPSIENNFNALENLDADQLSTDGEEDRKKIETIIYTHWVNEKNSSAEIESIKKFIESRELPIHNIELHFFATDTAQSKLASQIISKYFKENYNFSCDLKVIKNLSISSSEDFESKGLVNLANSILKTIERLKKVEGQIFINITGGYKGVIPYITLISQMYELPIFYLYENSSNIVTVPQLPIAFDWGVVEEYYYFLTGKGFIKSHSLSKNQKEELLLYGFCRPTENDNLERTGMGDIFVDWATKEHPSSYLTFGKFVELKLFEAYVNAGYSVKHSDRYTLKTENKGLQKGQEIDLLINYDNKDKEFIEIKSARDLIDLERHNTINTVKQFENRIKLIRLKELENITISFLIYNPAKFQDFINRHESGLKQTFEKMVDIVRENGLVDNVSIKFKYFQLNRTYKKEAYSEFLDRAVRIEDIKEIYFN